MAFERLRADSQFVLKRGVLAWGIPVGLAMYGLRSYQAGTWDAPRNLAISLAVSCAMGVVFGLLNLGRRK